MGATLVSASSYKRACENYRGFCTVCKKFTRYMTEPDAENYDCPKCQGNTVMGAEQALLTFTIDIK